MIYLLIISFSIKILISIETLVKISVIVHKIKHSSNIYGFTTFSFLDVFKD